MKKVLILIMSVCVLFTTFSQTLPQGINYQAVARDVNGQELVNQSLTVKFKILTPFTSPGSSVVQFEETHNLSTNNYGLFTTIIGNGTRTGGLKPTFSAIEWSTELHSLRVEIDYGNGYVSMGTTPFQSVPYALSSLDNNWFTNGSYIYNNNTLGVGIGTDNPDAALHIDIANKPQLLLDNGSDQTGDIVVPSGEILQIGHWDNTTATFTNRLNIESNGNIGIGTNNPQAELEVYDNGDNATLRIHEDAGSHEARLHLRRGGIDWEIINGNGNDFAIEHEASEKFRIDGNTGNVGIGKSVPSYKLDVFGDINFTGNLYQNGSLLNIGASNNLWNSLGISGTISFPNNVGIGSGFQMGTVWGGGNSNYPTNPLHVEDEGTEHGGTIDNNLQTPVDEVVARFKNTKTTTSPLTHSAVSVDAESGRDAIIYLSEDGDAKWGIRHDATDGSLEIRLQENGVNSKKFEITSSGEIKTSMRTKKKYISAANMNINGGIDDVMIKNGGLTSFNNFGNPSVINYILDVELELPDGAEITQAKILYYDNSTNDDVSNFSGGNLTRFSRTNPNNNSTLCYWSSISTTGTSSSMRTSTQTVTNNNIVSDNYFYIFKLGFMSNGSNHNEAIRFYGLEITYNTDKIE